MYIYRSKRKRTYIKAKDKVNKKSPETSQYSEPSSTPKKRGNLFFIKHLFCS